MPIQPLTEAQQQEAREKSVLARLERAALKKDLRSGVITLRQVLQEHCEREVVSRTKVIDLLRVFPGIGEIRAQEIMDQVGIAHSRRVRGLGQRQKDALVDYWEKNLSARIKV